MSSPDLEERLRRLEDLLEIEKELVRTLNDVIFILSVCESWQLAERLTGISRLLARMKMLVSELEQAGKGEV